MQEATIKDAPEFLNTNDQAMWVLGYNEAVLKMQCNGCAVQEGAHVPMGSVVKGIAEPGAAAIRINTSPMVSLATLTEGQRLIERQAGQIAELQAQLEAIGAGGVEPLRKPVQALPKDWVPCVITYEGQQPEEIAYGPQIMMDRLKKWLDRYFEMRANSAQLAAVQQGVQLTNEQIEAIEKQVWDLNHFDEVEREGNRKFAHLIAAASHPTQQGLDVAIAEIVGCLDAANAEGLDDALVSSVDYRLVDLVQRRLLPAFYTAIAAQAKQGGEA